MTLVIFVFKHKAKYIFMLQLLHKVTAGLFAQSVYSPLTANKAAAQTFNVWQLILETPPVCMRVCLCEFSRSARPLTNATPWDTSQVIGLSWNILKFHQFLPPVLSYPSIDLRAIASPQTCKLCMNTNACQQSRSKSIKTHYENLTGAVNNVALIVSFQSHLLQLEQFYKCVATARSLLRHTVWGIGLSLQVKSFPHQKDESKRSERGAALKPGHAASIPYRPTVTQFLTIKHWPDRQSHGCVGVRGVGISSTAKQTLLTTLCVRLTWNQIIDSIA